MLTKYASLLSLAAAAVSAAPLPPDFSPNGGAFACPVNVTITDRNAGVAIFFTTDGTTPTTSSTRFTSPIVVRAGETVKAIANDRTGSSRVAQALFRCTNIFDTFNVTIGVGNDDARTDSAITAMLTMASGATETWCLKYSDNGAFAPCGKNHPGITWGNFNVVPPPPPGVNPHRFSSGATGVADFSTLTITLMEFPGFLKSDDNWDLQSLKLDASAGTGPLTTILNVMGRTPPGSGTCYARFKHPHSSKTSTVVIHFNRSIPDVVMDDDGPHNAPYCKE